MKEYMAARRSTLVGKEEARRSNAIILARRAERKAEIIETLGNKCSVCGNSYHPNVYDFHHIDPEAKDGLISKLLGLADRSRLDDEIGKTVLMCANCHRMHHAKKEDRYNK